MLGTRTAIKEDLNATAAEMIYGTGIRLSAEFFIPTTPRANSEYASRLKEQMGNVSPHQVTRHGEKKIFVFRELESSPYVFLRHDAIGGRPRKFPTVSRHEALYLKSAMPTILRCHRYLYGSFAELSGDRTRGSRRGLLNKRARYRWLTKK